MSRNCWLPKNAIRKAQWVVTAKLKSTMSEAALIRRFGGYYGAKETIRKECNVSRQVLERKIGTVSSKVVFSESQKKMCDFMPLLGLEAFLTRCSRTTWTKELVK